MRIESKKMIVRPGRVLLGIAFFGFLWGNAESGPAPSGWNFRPALKRAVSVEEGRAASETGGRGRKGDAGGAGCLPADLRPLLKDRMAVLKYQLGEGKSRVLLFTKSGVREAVLPGKDRIESSVRGWLKALSFPSSGEDLLRRAAGRIARELIPFRDELAGLRVTDLIVIPDGILNRLPFEALRLDDARTGSFWVIEKFAVSYAPSEAVLKSVWLKPCASGGCLLAVGSSCLRRDCPVDGSGKRCAFRSLGSVRDEIRSVSRFFGRTRRLVYLDGDANENNLRKLQGKNFQVVHFASHGKGSDVDSLGNALVLTPGLGDDGYLQMPEIRDLNITAELVVLSACRTAAGADALSGGILGLPRVFIEAGARSVVATLWRISDRPAAEFMAEFYGLLKSGLGKSAALRAAKESMIRRGDAHPFLWAGYVLQGEPNGKIMFGPSINK